MAEPTRAAMFVIAAATVARIAVLATSSVPLSMDEAQYWIWSRTLDWGYFSKPPLLAWLVAGATRVCGDGEACVRAAMPLLQGATAVAIYAAGRQLFGAGVGAWSGVLYVLLPGVSVSGVIASTDAPLLLCWALAFYGLVRLLGAPRSRWWIVIGLGAGLGLLAKYAMAYFLICVVVFVMADRAARAVLLSRAGAGAVALAVLMVAPNLAWNAANGFVTMRHVADNMAATAPSLRPAAMLDFVAGQAGVFGPVLLVLLGAAALGLRREADRRYVLLACFSLPVLVLMTGQALLSRAHANWAATSYVAAVIWVAAWAATPPRRKLLEASVALHVMAAGVLYNFEALARALDIPLNRRIDPLVRIRGWDQAGAWAEKVIAAHPGHVLLFDDRNTMTELLYYTRRQPRPAVMWNPTGRRGNHFEMTTDLAAYAQSPVLYFTRQAQAGEAAGRYEKAEVVGRWEARAYLGHEMSLNALRLEGFRGYSEAVR